MNDQQAENLARLHEQLRLYMTYPELIPYVSNHLSGPAYLNVTSEGLDEIDTWEERSQERSRRKIRAQVRALRNCGFDIEKKPQDNGDLVVVATKEGTDIVVNLYASGYCTFTETEVKERVAVVEVPTEIEKAYTRIELKPVTKRVCVPLLAQVEVEDL